MHYSSVYVSHSHLVMHVVLFFLDEHLLLAACYMGFSSSWNFLIGVNLCFLRSIIFKMANDKVNLAKF